MNLPAVRSLLLTGALLLIVRECESVCCNPPGTGWLVGSGLHSLYARCGDGTQPTPCCGYGACNFFCCNCDGGCRKRDRRKRQEETDEAQDEDDDHFARNDGDGDGRISGDEARRWIMAGGCGNPVLKVGRVGQEFDNLDQDGDGFLDRNEIGG